MALGEKRRLSTCFVVEDHNGTTLGFDILNIQAWHPMVSSVWSFGSNLAPKPERKQGVQCVYFMQSLHSRFQDCNAQLLLQHKMEIILGWQQT